MSYRKARWILTKMPRDTDVEDVLDVLLSNIASPADFVADVRALSVEYDEDYEGHTVRNLND